MFPKPRYEFLDDCGMSTVEYTVGLLVAAGLAMILFGVIQSGEVEEGLSNLIERALNVKG